MGIWGKGHFEAKEHFSTNEHWGKWALGAYGHLGQMGIGTKEHYIGACGD